MVALLLLAAWPVLSAHPVLQHLGLIHEAHADHDSESAGSHEHNDGNHSVADGQCLLTSTTVKASAPCCGFTLFLICHIAKEWNLSLDRQQLSSGLAPPSLVPPELTHRWQFSFRTALPARAPSFVS
jgi:hypothetical protein